MQRRKHSISLEATTCQRLPPDGPSSPCGPYLLHFPDRVCLGATGRFYVCFTGIGFIDNWLHRYRTQKARLAVFPAYEAVMFNPERERFDFDHDHQGHRVLNTRTGLPIVERRIIGEEPSS